MDLLRFVATGDVVGVVRSLALGADVNCIGTTEVSLLPSDWLWQVSWLGLHCEALV